jgi:hypothetical protein
MQTKPRKICGITAEEAIAEVVNEDIFTVFMFHDLRRGIGFTNKL